VVEAVLFVVFVEDVVYVVEGLVAIVIELLEEEGERHQTQERQKQQVDKLC